MPLTVNEIFYSLQGEGFHTGTPSVFLRLSGCNLACPFCDTHHNDGTVMEEWQILNEISAYPSRHIVITGGEPALQLTAEFVELLHTHGWFIQVETNGTLPLPSDIDWVTCSPKTDTVRCGKTDEIKLLFQGDGTDHDRIRLFESIDARYYCLQPCDHAPKHGNHAAGDAWAPSPETEKRNQLTLHACIDYIKAHPKWRLSLQTHKLLNIP